MKTIALDPTYMKRTEAALAETKRLLNKELSFSEDLQDKKQIAFYNGHIEKLQKFISQGFVEL